MLHLKKISFLSFLIFFSCLKQTNTNWDSDFVLPIANSSLNIKNFFGDTLLKPDNNGLLNFVFNRELLAIKLDSLINITREMQRISELNTLVYQGNAGNLVKMNTLTNQRKDGNSKSRGYSKLACLDLALKILGRNDAAVQLRLKQIQLCKDAFFVHA